jgi:hypothetical protein
MARAYAFGQSRGPVLRGTRRAPAPEPPLPSFPLPLETADPWDEVTRRFVRKSRPRRVEDALKILFGVVFGVLVVLVARGDAQACVRAARQLVAEQILRFADGSTPVVVAENPPPPSPAVAEPRPVEPSTVPSPAPPAPIIVAQRPIPTVDVRDLPRVRRHR